MGTTNLTNRCLILGGGEIADYASASERINKSDFVLCADSGFNHCARLNVTPNLLVGDFDSIGSAPEDIPRLGFPAEKDYTDSTLAMRVALGKGFRRILFMGMLGGRFDHTLANLQNLAWCAVNSVEATITDGSTDVYAVADGALVLPPRDNHYFSVFSLTSVCEDVNIEGARYPLENYRLTFDCPRAVSNEFTGKSARVTVKSGVIAVMVVKK